MNFAEHYNLRGKHAFLSASNYHWINYDDDRLISVYRNLLAKERGTQIHEFACDAIRLGMKLSHSKGTVNQYVNDAIGFGLSPETILYYSDNCFGTADAIDFDEHEGRLRIHDLKTGKIKASFNQLVVYAALFCLEYGVPPQEIEIVLRIYQENEKIEELPQPSEILAVMEKIQRFDPIINELRLEGAL